MAWRGGTLDVDNFHVAAENARFATAELENFQLELSMCIGAGNAGGFCDSIQFCLDHAQQLSIGNVVLNKSDNLIVGAVGTRFHLELLYGWSTVEAS